MTNLQVIEEREVLGKGFRIYGDFENPLFLAKDVAEWIDRKKTAEMIMNVDEDEKLMAIISHSGQNREMWFLTEDGLYEVLMQSRKPIAKQFKKEVKVILKSIRKHGAYMTESVTERALTDPDFLIQLATTIKEERQARLEAEQQVQQLAPKGEYHDRVLQSESLLTVTQIAKDYGMSARKLNNLLHEKGVQFKESGMWMLYQKYADKGYTHSKTFVAPNGDTSVQTYWTQKGRKFIDELLQK